MILKGFAVLLVQSLANFALNDFINRADLKVGRRDRGLFCLASILTKIRCVPAVGRQNSKYLY